MATVVQSCRIPKKLAPILARQARRKNLEVSSLCSLYLHEKALEEEYPGIGFRDAAGGREAYIQGHRVAIWQVEEVQRETKSITKTADYFRWPESLVKCALLFAQNFHSEVESQRQAESQ